MDGKTDFVARNYDIVEKRMIEQMEKSLRFGKDLIDTELNAGLLDFIVKPIVKSFYKYWSNNDARVGTLQQIKVTLDSARKLIYNGNSSEKFEQVMEENFPLYLAGDQTSRQCSSSHKNYAKLKEMCKKIFASQLQESINFLKVEKEVKTYDDLCKIAYTNKAKAHEALIRQLTFNEDCIKILEQDPSILKIPVGKSIILKVLRKGMDQTRKELIKNLDDTFN